MSTKQEHLRYIKEKGKFTVDCSNASFSTEDIEILEKWGHWFNALTSGDLEPITDAQRRFILVATGKEDHFSLEEAAWRLYLDQKAYEARRRDGVIMQYHPDEDTFYNRDLAKKLKSTMYKVMKENHRN